MDAKTICLILMVVFGIYILSFKVYRIQKNPTWRGIIHEIRMLIAERLLGYALRIAPPDTNESRQLAQYIHDYFNTKLNADIETRAMFTGINIKGSTSVEEYKKHIDKTKN